MKSQFHRTKHFFTVLILFGLILPYCCCMEISSGPITQEEPDVHSCCQTEPLPQTTSNTDSKSCDCGSHSSVILEKTDSFEAPSHTRNSGSPTHLDYGRFPISGLSPHVFAPERLQRGKAPPLFILYSIYRL